MSTTRFLPSSSVANGKIYVIGGTRDWQGETLSLVEEYDPVTDTWTRKTDMPTARFALASCAINNKIYAIGGTKAWTGVSSFEKPIPTVEEYIPEGLAVSSNGKLPKTWGTIKAK